MFPLISFRTKKYLKKLNYLLLLKNNDILNLFNLTIDLFVSN